MKNEAQVKRLSEMTDDEVRAACKRADRQSRAAEVQADYARTNRLAKRRMSAFHKRTLGRMS